jgi:predicted amidohydrolase
MWKRILRKPRILSVSINNRDNPFYIAVLVYFSQAQALTQAGNAKHICGRVQNLLFLGSAAAKGAHIVLLQELFACRYFPIDQVEKFDLAVTKEDQKSYLARFRNLAKELKIVLPLSFYEKDKYVSTLLQAEMFGN